MTGEAGTWRSMLFVPAHADKFVERAHTRGADAYVLDLEDSVPVAYKAVARDKIIDAARTVSQAGAAVLVRINSDPELAELDLHAVVNPAVQALVLPKVVTGAAVQSIAATLDSIERERGMPCSHTRLIALIEDVRALPHLDEIASSSPRLIGMTLGSEDFAASVGMEPIPEALLGPSQQVLFACARAGILAFGFPGSIADYADLEAFRQRIRLARRLGFVGALCIHPSQVTVMNQEFVPSVTEVDAARGLLAAYEQACAAGRGAFEYHGRMVDAPVVARAQLLLRRAQLHCSPK